jgi:hypothetical protein
MNINVRCHILLNVENMITAGGLISTAISVDASRAPPWQKRSMCCLRPAPGWTFVSAVGLQIVGAATLLS